MITRDAHRNPMTLRPVPRAPERSPADYAIEFGEYLAVAAEAFIADMGSSRVTDPDATIDAYRSLRSAIYEFRKRAARAAPVSDTCGQCGHSRRAEIAPCVCSYAVRP